MKRRGAVLAVVVSALVPALFLFSGASASVRDLAVAMTGSGSGGPATVAIYVVVFALIQECCALPVSYYRSFLLERRYGLSAEPPGTWAADHAKAAAIAVVIAIIAAQVVFFTLRQWPDYWWMASAVILMAGIGLMAKLAPVLLLPLFYSFTPLGRDSLRTRLVSLSSKAGVPVLGVYEWGLGEKTRRANAALVGTGATRRILISDTLLAAYSDDEIEVILAHEIAHHVHRDILKGLALEFLLMVAAFGAAAAALERWGVAVGQRALHDVAGLPLILLTAGAVMLGATPLVHAVSRFNERRADRYALDLTRQPGPFISAMRRLAAQNLAEERPSRLALWLFHSHPPIDQRIDAARARQTELMAGR